MYRAWPAEPLRAASGITGRRRRPARIPAAESRPAPCARQACAMHRLNRRTARFGASSTPASRSVLPSRPYHPRRRAVGSTPRTIPTPRGAAAARTPCRHRPASTRPDPGRLACGRPLHRHSRGSPHTARSRRCPGRVVVNTLTTCTTITSPRSSRRSRSSPGRAFVSFTVFVLPRAFRAADAVHLMRRTRFGPMSDEPPPLSVHRAYRTRDRHP